jgi:hypothetical protein
VINPEWRTVCDCGWSFAERIQGERARATTQLGIGALLLVAGIVITAVTYGGASRSGGTYVIAYGPIVLGLVYIVRGMITRND